MMLAVLLGLAAAVGVAEAAMPVADAERGFAAMAQRDGQWTAFRATATADAIMFVPGKVKAQDWLKGRADPAKAVAWAPDATVTACDGSLAVTTGPYREPEGVTGRFSTVWQRQADGSWKWVLDLGTPGPTNALDTVTTRVLKADCRNIAKARVGQLSPVQMQTLMGTKGSVTTVPLLAHGASDDATLQWAVRGDEKGLRWIVTWLWDGRNFKDALRQDTP